MADDERINTNTFFVASHQDSLFLFYSSGWSRESAQDKARNLLFIYSSWSFTDAHFFLGFNRSIHTFVRSHRHRCCFQFRNATNSNEDSRERVDEENTGDRYIFTFDGERPFFRCPMAKTHCQIGIMEKLGSHLSGVPSRHSRNALGNEPVLHLDYTNFHDHLYLHFLLIVHNPLVYANQESRRSTQARYYLTRV